MLAATDLDHGDESDVDGSEDGDEGGAEARDQRHPQQQPLAAQTVRQGAARQHRHHHPVVVPAWGQPDISAVLDKLQKLLVLL